MDVRSAPTVQTVLGPVAAAELGPTLMHEHILASMASHWQEPTAAADRELSHQPLDLELLWRVRADHNLLLDNCELRDREVAVRELKLFREAGGATVVELSSVGLARDVEGLADVAARSGVRIVCGTGYYVAASHPPGTADRDVEDLAEEMAREIREGIGDTGIRAGAIGEIGVSEPMAPVECTVLLAAARAQRMTGAALVVHPGAGIASIGAVADLVEGANVDPTRVVLAHADERLRGDVAGLIALLRRGFTLGFDTFGRDGYMPWRRRQHPSDARRIETLVGLLDAGFAGQVVLSQDLAWKHELTAFGGQGYGHVLRNIVPRLRQSGVPDETIRQMLVENPQRLLAFGERDSRGIGRDDSHEAT